MTSLERAIADFFKEMTMLAQNVNTVLEDQMRKDNIEIEREEERAEQGDDPAPSPRPRRRRK